MPTLTTWLMLSLLFQVARKKMLQMNRQGLVAYFDHKIDEYGVYFFDPYYYETTEPFYSNLKLVTLILSY